MTTTFTTPTFSRGCWQFANRTLLVKRATVSGSIRKWVLF
jgi:hypothetical protein